MKFFEQNDVLKQLASKMGEYANVDDFHPLDNVAHDYAVLEWMRDVVRVENVTTYGEFIAMVSGPMHLYKTGDYVKGAIFSIGIIDTSK